MVAVLTPAQETERLLVLQSYGALDTPPEPAFDELVALAARICGTPISLISLIDQDRQWFKARHGIAAAETPRTVSFCVHALGQPGELLLVPDATLDARFAHNPLVTGEAGLRFYAGMPLSTPAGHALGTLCVIDRQPRHLDPGQQEALRVLGHQVMALLELRRIQNETHLNHLRLENSQRIAALGDWEYDFVHQRLVWSGEVYRILGLSQQDAPPHSETFYRQVHPDDLAFVHREKKAAAEGSRRGNFEHRIIRPNGEVRYLHQIVELILDDQARSVRESGTIQDITERKLAEGALRQSEERHRKLLMLSPDANVVHVDGLITLVNHAFCQLMRADDPAQLLGRLALSVVHPDYHALVRARRDKTFGDDLPRRPSEMKFVRLDGTTVEVEVASVTFDFNGRREVQVIARDISARKQAEEELRAQQAQLLEALQIAKLAYWEYDVLNDRFHFNDQFYAILRTTAGREGGYAMSSAHYAERFVHPADAALVGQEIQRALASPDPNFSRELNHRIIYADGEVGYIIVHIRLQKDAQGRTIRTHGANMDITAAKQAEERLRESEERFKFVARAISDVVWDWDLATNSLWWNDGFFTTFGFAPGEIGPTIESWITRIHPEDRSRVVDSIHHAIAAGTESWSAEYRFQRKNGTHAFVQDRGYILRDDAGKGTRMVGGMRDLTEQKKMEAQYLRAQRMDSIGTLAGGIAHDLNNVLAPIMMSIELLKLDAGDDPNRNKILDTIYVSSRRGADLVRQVLSFARGLDGQRVTIQLRSLIEELKTIISETFRRNIRIVTHVPNNLWPVTGDPSQLHQVLLNLAVNARDAMPQGGTLTMSAANLAIDAQYAGTSQEAKAGSYVLLQVTDTGIGIPPEVRERIFEPFFTTKGLGEGTGLGLATVHTIVKSHGGFLGVESEVGRGTTFKVYLPADPAHRSTVAAPPVADLPRGQDELVLVVDDEFSIRDITRQTLEAFGYRVLTAGNGAEAIALYAAQTQQIAVVLTDMMMPVMDGSATIQVLTRINPAIKIIAASGLESGNTVAKARNAGVKHFLLKPYTAEALLQLIREVLDAPAGTALAR